MIKMVLTPVLFLMITIIIIIMMIIVLSSIRFPKSGKHVPEISIQQKNEHQTAIRKKEKMIKISCKIKFYKKIYIGKIKEKRIK